MSFVGYDGLLLIKIDVCVQSKTDIYIATQPRCPSFVRSFFQSHFLFQDATLVVYDGEGKVDGKEVRLQRDEKTLVEVD